MNIDIVVQKLRVQLLVVSLEQSVVEVLQSLGLRAHLLPHERPRHRLQAVLLLQDLLDVLDGATHLWPVLRVVVEDFGSVDRIALWFIRVRNILIAGRARVLAPYQQLDVLQLLAVVAVVVLVAADDDLGLLLRPCFLG